MTTDANPDLESTPPCRECWANCGVEADEEMREIDRLEDELSPLPENVTRISKLISTLELCHHKAERWVTNIIEAIGYRPINPPDRSVSDRQHQITPKRDTFAGSLGDGRFDKP